MIRTRPVGTIEFLADLQQNGYAAARWMRLRLFQRRMWLRRRRLLLTHVNKPLLQAGVNRVYQLPAIKGGDGIQ